MDPSAVIRILWSLVLCGQGANVGFNFHAPPSHPFIRAAAGMPPPSQGTFHHAVAGGVSLFSTSLLLVGGRGSCTAWHRDWTAAYNQLFLVAGTPGARKRSRRDAVGAVWAFMPPSAAAPLISWLHDQGEGRGVAGGTPFVGDAFRRMCQDLAPHGLVVVEQRAGDTVFVPPGWFHTVWNLLPNCKVARDVLEYRHMAQYVRGARAGALSYPRAPRDCMMLRAMATAVVLAASAGWAEMYCRAARGAHRSPGGAAGAARLA